MKPILIISSTRQEIGAHESLELYKSISKLPKNNYILNITCNNKKGMPEIYNEALKQVNEKDHDIILFCHDDVYIDDLKLQEKLYKAINYFDIIGLAGTNNVKIRQPVLWHLMSTKEQWSGAVQHPTDKTQTHIHTTSFGPYPKRCLVLDGLFLAINIKKIKNSNWLFNENYTFHHYDIASCLDANKKKLKMGTWPIYVIHKSPGLLDTNDHTWKESEKKFLKEYSQ